MKLISSSHFNLFTSIPISSPSSTTLLESPAEWMFSRPCVMGFRILGWASSSLKSSSSIFLRISASMSGLWTISSSTTSFLSSTWRMLAAWESSTRLGSLLDCVGVFWTNNIVWHRNKLNVSLHWPFCNQCEHLNPRCQLRCLCLCYRQHSWKS